MNLVEKINRLKKEYCLEFVSCHRLDTFANDVAVDQNNKKIFMLKPDSKKIDIYDFGFNLIENFVSLDERPIRMYLLKNRNVIVSVEIKESLKRKLILMNYNGKIEQIFEFNDFRYPTYIFETNLDNVVLISNAEPTPLMVLDLNTNKTTFVDLTGYYPRKLHIKRNGNIVFSNNISLKDAFNPLIVEINPDGKIINRPDISKIPGQYELTGLCEDNSNRLYASSHNFFFKLNEQLQVIYRCNASVIISKVIDMFPFLKGHKMHLYENYFLYDENEFILLSFFGQPYLVKVKIGK